MQNKNRTAQIVAKLLPSALCILVTLFAGLAAVRAWFSMNASVDASGMKVKIDTSDSYLVIADSAEALRSAGAQDVSVSFNGPAAAYVPVTHEADVTEGGTHHLKYAFDQGDIDPDTGIAESNVFQPVPSATYSGLNYFVDFTVYIGAINSALTGTDLIASWGEGIVNDGNTDMQKAASIDFYDMSTPSVDYLGTMHLNSQDKLTILSNVRIPNVTENEPIVILMRFYYDGALTYTSGGKTVSYIRTANVDNSSVNLGIRFDAETHEDS